MKKYGLAEGDTHLAEERYSGGNVEWCNDNPPVPGKYDLIVLYNWLQTAEQPQVLKVLRYYTELLKDGGQMVVVVPSLDWAVNELALKNNPSIAAYVAIYGTPGEPHRCGFTMHFLRLVLSQTPNLMIEYATTEGVLVTIGEEKTLAQQNVIACTKQVRQAEEAIE